jgi:hypothetical protein
MMVDIPSGATPGERVQICLPLPSNAAPGHAAAQEISPATLGGQCYAIAWKDYRLACGCRKRAGQCGWLSPKCCELFCYALLFVIMALVAIANQVRSSTVDSIPTP